MNFWSGLRKIFRFGARGRQFSLENESWERPEPIKPKPEPLYKDLVKNQQLLEKIFELPANQDIVVRDFLIPSLQRKALLIYIDGLSDRNTQSFAVLQPLMVLGPVEANGGKDPIAIAYEKLVPGHQIQKTKYLKDVIDGVLDGSSALLIDGSDQALVIETKGWEHRGVDRPNNEPVVRGPQEAFVESFRANTASVRRYVKDPKLITELFRVGKRSRTLVAVMYVKDIANPKLVEEVKYRIESIAEMVDFIPETGTLEEYLEDHPKSLIPQMLSTERPDRLGAYIREGYVGLVMANSPFSLVIPTTFTIFLHSAEDYYLRWPFGNFIRLIRAIAIFIALMMPATYIAIVNYHQEMIPPDLLMAMTAAREAVPFPALAEILFMEFSFELIREAGVRIPSIIGPTIGIVGALILGQAAVSASIVSPILIIIIAITALASFVVPNYNASLSVRISRFIFIILAGFLGFFGIAFGVFLLILHLANINSFGIPFMTPIAPYTPENKDRVIRPREYDQPYRPVYLKPLDWIRQEKNPRRWDRPHINTAKGADEDE
jgi:spore germination protein KA